MTRFLLSSISPAGRATPGMKEAVVLRAGPPQPSGFTGLTALMDKLDCSVPAFGPHLACSCDFWQAPSPLSVQLGYFVAS